MVLLRKDRARRQAGILLIGLAFGATLTVMAAVNPARLPIASELAKQLRAHVEFLAAPALKGRQPGTPGNRAAAEYIVARFREAGLQPLPSLSTTSQVGGTASQAGYGQPLPRNLGSNLLAMRPAADPAGSASAPPRWILLGAHYDHLGGSFLGADDNASAIAILLETASTLPPLPHHPVLFVAFNAEEPPYIRTPDMGSQYFADHLPAEIGSLSRIQAVLIMDLMGGVHWEPLQQVVFAAGAEQSPALYRRVRESAQFWGLPSPVGLAGYQDVAVLPVGMHLVEEIPLLGRVSFSDYDAFRNEQVPFLFLSSGRTPRYHQPTDLPDTLHYERMAATVAWLRVLLSLIDQDRAPYRFEPDRVEFADEVATFRPLVAFAADGATKIPNTSPISLWKLKRDHEWLQQVNPASPTREDLKRLESLSLRMQCLLADLYVCFLL